MSLELNPILLAASPTRRRILTGIAAGLGTLAARPAFAQAQPALAQAQMEQKPPSAANAALTSLHYELDFKATPQHMCETLLGSKPFAAFSGMPAEIDAKPGGAFSIFGGMVAGRIVELVENQRIVQAWRSASWKAGVYSIAHFEIKPRGTESSLVFDHTGFAAGLHDSLDEGWRGHYWEPLKKYFAGT
jgi:activator of HSP90 ATPase